MLILILFLVVGAIIAYLAQFNLMPVSLNLGHYTFPHIPLFYVIIGSILVGVGLAYLIYLVHAISTAFSLHAKDTKIKQTKHEVTDLTKRVHQLELENERLKKNSKVEYLDSNAL